MKRAFRELETAGDNIQVSFDNKNTFENYDKNTALAEGIPVPNECTDLDNIVIKTDELESANLAYEIPASLFGQSYLYHQLDPRVKNIKIPDEVTSIGPWAFEGCRNLTNINYKGTESQWNKIHKDVYWNLDCPAVINYISK